MKKLLIVLSSCLISALVVAQDLKIEEVIAKNLAAIGQEKLAKIQTIKITGKMVQSGLELLVTQYQKKPDIARQEIEVQGVKVIMVVNGNTGWAINPMTGSSDPQDLSQEMITTIKGSDKEDPVISWDNPFSNWKENGTVVEMAGKEIIDGIPVYNLKFTFKDKSVVNYFVDATKFVVIRQKSTKSVQGQTFDQELRYSDFRDDSGILNPGKMEVLVNGQQGQIYTTDKCEFNIPINDSLFIKPVKIKN
jgi:hypothetical protein